MRHLRGFTSLVTVTMATISTALAAEMAPLKQEAQTAHYRLELQIGPTEKMFSPQEVAAKHISDGEVMIGGGMSMGMDMGGMNMDMGDTRHLEVHVYSLKTAAVVTNAKVKILVTDLAAKKTEDVTAAKMYGIKEGPPDTHYGNNVKLPAGNYQVEVRVNGEKADFTVAIPAS
jgi:hypothetical protein